MSEIVTGAANSLGFANAVLVGQDRYVTIPALTQRLA